MDLELEESGICEGISEVIVTTKSTSGVPNAAPIGIITIPIITEDKNKDKDKHRHFVKLYKGSKTLSNVIETKELAANVTDDVIIFVEAAFEGLNEAHFSLLSGFPVLKDAEAWVLFKSSFKEENSDAFLFQLEPTAVKINRKEVKVKVKAINRGLNAVIEAIILATRYRSVITEDKGKKEKIKKLMEHYEAIVEKCGGRREKEAMKNLSLKRKLY